jgi:hypothetical protein
MTPGYVSFSTFKKLTPRIWHWSNYEIWTRVVVLLENHSCNL